MHERSVEDAPKGTNSAAELQHLAQKLAALAEQIKTITATPIGETVNLHKSIKMPRKRSLE
ncbi:hypothetical protein [Ensifer adhaerens]|uniref:hypothetical protein n=1 Tax=Ensifer adhaerens TaxID=106592 RepID=UPI000CF11182|nr:hypothetical protein [Ensifer adhaerens]